MSLQLVQSMATGFHVTAVVLKMMRQRLPQAAGSLAELTVTQLQCTHPKASGIFAASTST